MRFVQALGKIQFSLLLFAPALFYYNGWD